MSRNNEINTTNVKLFVWTFSWVGTLAIATLGHKLIWEEENTTLSLIAILFNVCVGIGWIYANRTLITKLDELQRKIHLEAMAITLGLAVILGVAFSTLDITNVISFDAEISGLITFIGISYFVNIVIGNWRYK